MRIHVLFFLCTLMFYMLETHTAGSLNANLTTNIIIAGGGSPILPPYSQEVFNTTEVLFGPKCPLPPLPVPTLKNALVIVSDQESGEKVQALLRRNCWTQSRIM